MKRYFLSLFAGIGGFDLGAERAGLRFDGHYYSEIDSYACKVMALRFPRAVGLGDITKIDVEELPHGDWVVAGGFPCQDISAAGRGAGLEGARSGLWFEYLRIVEGLRPSFAAVENVGALVGRGLDRVLESLAAIGYDAEWQDIRASDVGAPHRRERIWIVAYPAGGECYAGTEEPGELQAVHGDRSEHDNADGSGANVADASGDGRCEGRPESEGKQGRSCPAECGEPVGGWWAAEPDVGRVAHGVPARVDRLKCLGNSIVPQIAELIFRDVAFDGYRS